MPPRSRATRNQDAAARSRQGQALDLDPMDGLPVQRYTLATVKMNQDDTTETTTMNAKSTDSPAWKAQFNTPQYPWEEPALPTFYHQIPAHNQELIRRARAGNTNAKTSVWDSKNSCWMSAAEAEKKATPLKSLHLNNLPDNDAKMTNADDASQKSDDEDHDSSESSKSSDDEEENAPFNMTIKAKRRKLASQNADDARLIEVKRWVHMPAQSDNLKERNFLAARRAGMPPLYQSELTAKLFGQYHSSSVIGGPANYDLGDGGGLSNAAGVLNAGTETGGAATPRKNIPPRRKKKKLGGPGRRKAIQQPVQQVAVPIEGTAPADAMQGLESTETPAPDKAEDGEDQEGNDSGSEAEGSEEGEIDESGGAKPADETIVSTPKPADDPAVSASEVVPVQAEPPALEPVQGDAVIMSEISEVVAEPQPPAEVIADVPASVVQPPVPEPEPQIPGLDSAESPFEAGQPPVETIDLPKSPSVAQLTSAPEPASIAALELQPKDREEEQIVEENAQAITEADEPGKEQIAGVSEAITEAVVEGKVLEPQVPEAAEIAVEVDLLGAMDAAIDQGMNGGVQ